MRWSHRFANRCAAVTGVGRDASFDRSARLAPAAARPCVSKSRPTLAKTIVTVCRSLHPDRIPIAGCPTINSGESHQIGGPDRVVGHVSRHGDFFQHREFVLPAERMFTFCSSHEQTRKSLLPSSGSDRMLAKVSNPEGAAAVFCVRRSPTGTKSAQNMATSIFRSQSSAFNEES